MFSLKENIRNVLECHFSQSKDELIDSATDIIFSLYIKKLKIMLRGVEDENNKET